jgi:hypothetical protein
MVTEHKKAVWEETFAEALALHEQNMADIGEMANILFPKRTEQSTSPERSGAEQSTVKSNV